MEEFNVLDAWHAALAASFADPDHLYCVCRDDTGRPIVTTSPDDSFEVGFRYGYVLERREGSPFILPPSPWA